MIRNTYPWKGVGARHPERIRQNVQKYSDASKVLAHMPRQVVGGICFQCKRYKERLDWSHITSHFGIKGELSTFNQTIDNQGQAGSGGSAFYLLCRKCESQASKAENILAHYCRDQPNELKVTKTKIGEWKIDPKDSEYLIEAALGILLREDAARYLYKLPFNTSGFRYSEWREKTRQLVLKSISKRNFNQFRIEIIKQFSKNYWIQHSPLRKTGPHGHGRINHSSPTLINPRKNDGLLGQVYIDGMVLRVFDRRSSDSVDRIILAPWTPEGVGWKNLPDRSDLIGRNMYEIAINTSDSDFCPCGLTVRVSRPSSPRRLYSECCAYGWMKDFWITFLIENYGMVRILPTKETMLSLGWRETTLIIG